MEVQLPGGLFDNQRIERRVRFYPLTGRIEQSLIEAPIHQDKPAYITNVLCNVLDKIGELPANPVNVSRLSVADRQYLMLRLAAMLNGEQVWIKVDCGHCNSAFDVELRRCDLPVKEAGNGYPKIKLQLRNSEIEIRVPTGLDQEGISDLGEDEAIRWLIQNCIDKVNGQNPTEDFFDNLSEQDISRVDDALDAIAPAVCNELVAICPECKTEQNVTLDHSAHIGLNKNYFYQEIHTLASHYHWSEADILNLPRSKRKRYLDLINRYPSN